MTRKPKPAGPSRQVPSSSGRHHSRAQPSPSPADARATCSLSFETLASRAQRSLARRDPILKQLIRTVGPCTLRPDSDGFAVLVRAIVAQLISTRAAATVQGRLEALLGAEPGVTPEAVLQAGTERLRSVGLSGAKVRALLDLAERCTTGTLPMEQLPGMTDEEVIAHLLPVRGVGVWTAHMFLIFCLGRLDVLAVGDLGLRAGVMEQYQLQELPNPEMLREHAEVWRPYRTIATWYFWRSRGGVPQS